MRVTADVSTRPSIAPVAMLSRPAAMAPATADQLPALVPTSHTGTSAWFSGTRRLRRCRSHDRG
ncbi:hypothetical protein [Bradyrhizobium sp.]|uniref:hypothetical protein n=1 Tax=Bradyrhizobium sp. TaxID=376 RepID=UPI001ED3ACEB|nr:hypothetical protein [Bradyrhizobium sp.]MBV8920135.1 hypothetical protein [Bradyrhizobium sp.]MBV9981092.1 hypothetical protein [Bradyrhizobium sp.]